MQHATNCMTKRAHSNTVFKSKNKSFSVLVGHGLY